MPAFQAFANDTQSYSVGSGDGLTIVNGTDLISIYGEVKFKADAAGQERARELLGILIEIQSQLGDGASGKKLSAKSKAGALAISGDVDLDKGGSSKGALAEATEALGVFCAKPAASSKPV